VPDLVSNEIGENEIYSNTSKPLGDFGILIAALTLNGPLLVN